MLPQILPRLWLLRPVVAAHPRPRAVPKAGDEVGIVGRAPRAGAAAPEVARLCRQGPAAPRLYPATLPYCALGPAGRTHVAAQRRLSKHGLDARPCFAALWAPCAAESCLRARKEEEPAACPFAPFSSKLSPEFRMYSAGLPHLQHGTCGGGARARWGATGSGQEHPASSRGQVEAPISDRIPITGPISHQTAGKGAGRCCSRAAGTPAAARCAPPAPTGCPQRRGGRPPQAAPTPWAPPAQVGGRAGQGAGLSTIWGNGGPPTHQAEQAKVQNGSAGCSTVPRN